MDKVWNEDCIEGMKSRVPDCSIDVCITDPPYGISFMGRNWDKFKEGKNIAGGTSRGTPYSRNTQAPAFFQITSNEMRDYQVWTTSWAKEVYRVLKPGAYMLVFGGTRTYHRLVCGIEDAGFIIKDCLCWIYASGFGKGYNISKGFDKRTGIEMKNVPKSKECSGKFDNRDSSERVGEGFEPTTDLAKEWGGWGTALKPAWEPIVLAQKPREGTYCENVERHGVGGLNIDDTRVPYQNEEDRESAEPGGRVTTSKPGQLSGPQSAYEDNERVEIPKKELPGGRFPANVMVEDTGGKLLGDFERFFVVPKESKRDDYNKHPTVKPVGLIKRLIDMTTRLDYVILDPFMGSGTTAVACLEKGRHFIGFEQSKEYIEITDRRLEVLRRQDKLEGWY